MYINEHIIQCALYVKCRASAWLLSLGRTWVHGEITPVICAGLCQQYTYIFSSSWSCGTHSCKKTTIRAASIKINIMALVVDYILWFRHQVICCNGGIKMATHNPIIWDLQTDVRHISLLLVFYWVKNVILKCAKKVLIFLLRFLFVSYGFIAILLLLQETIAETINNQI